MTAMNLLAPSFTTKAMSSVQYKEFASAMEPQKGGLHSSHFQVQRTRCFSHIFQVSHTPRSVPSFQDPSRSLPMYSDHGSPGPNPQIQSRRILDMGVNGFVFRFTCLFPVDSAWYWQGDKGEYGVHTPGGEAACRMPTLPIWPVEAHHPHQNHHYLLLLSSSSSSSSLSCMVFWNTTWQRLKTWPRHRSTRMTHVLPRPSQGGKRTATSPWCQASKWSHSSNQLEHQHLKLTQLGFLIPLSCFDIRHRKASARGCQIYRKRASSPNWLLLWNVGDKWNQIEIKVWAL